MGENGGENLYSFVYNDPFLWYDYLGGKPKNSKKGTVNCKKKVRYPNAKNKKIPKEKLDKFVKDFEKNEGKDPSIKDVSDYLDDVDDVITNIIGGNNGTYAIALMQAENKCNAHYLQLYITGKITSKCKACCVAVFHHFNRSAYEDLSLFVDYTFIVGKSCDQHQEYLEKHGAAWNALPGGLTREVQYYNY